jgi:predicted aspartyl protease
MNNRSLTRRAISLFVLLLAAVAAPALHAAEVRFQLVHDALIVVPVTANDQGPFCFLLDTGADTTIVDPALATKLGLPTLQSIQQTTVTGVQTVGVSLLASLAVGGVHVDRMPVLEQDLSGLRRMDKRIMGIVGQNFLSHFNFLVDYRASSLRMEAGDELRSSIDGEVLPVEVKEHRMIVAAEAQSKGTAKVRLILDSGANALVLTQRAGDALHCPILRPAVEMSSTSGVAAVRTGRADLRVAAHALRDVPVSLVADALPQSIGDGLLPMSLFDAVYVNNAQGYVVLNPRLKKAAVLVASAAGE